MNHDELITAVRESVISVHTATSAEQIIRRGRAVRARRRVPRVAAALGGAAAVAVAVSVALPAGHPGAGHPASGHASQLAAWTVTRQADGSIQVTFREMRDAAGLQRVLRADGVPASVTFPGQQNPACRAYPFSSRYDSSQRAAALRSHGRLGQPAGVWSWGPHNGKPTPYALIIRPAALPSGAGLTLFGQGRDIGEPYDQQMGAPVGLSVGLVQASPQCTGS